MYIYAKIETQLANRHKLKKKSPNKKNHIKKKSDSGPVTRRTGAGYKTNIREDTTCTSKPPKTNYDSICSYINAYRMSILIKITLQQ